MAGEVDALMEWGWIAIEAGSEKGCEWTAGGCEVGGGVESSWARGGQVAEPMKRLHDALLARSLGLGARCREFASGGSTSLLSPIPSAMCFVGGEADAGETGPGDKGRLPSRDATWGRLSREWLRLERVKLRLVCKHWRVVEEAVT